MADTTTPNLKLTNQTEGANSNTWGTIADTNFEEIDDKFGDTTDVTTTGGDTTLTDAQEIVAIIQVAGTLASNANIIFSGRGGVWIVENNTTGSFTLTCKLSASSGVEIPQGDSAVIYCDGSDILRVNTQTLSIDDTDASHQLTLAAGSNLTADRTLTFTTGDADRTLTIEGNATIGQDLSVDADVTFGSLTLDNDGLHLLDSDASHDLIVKPGSNLTADRTLTLTTGDADRSVTISGNATLKAGTMAALDQEDQTVSGGAVVTSKALGTDGVVSTGTVTPDPGDRPMQHYQNNGAHTLAPGTKKGAYILDITNGASAGAITTSGWTKVSGDDFTTTNAHKFRCHCSIGEAGSLLVVQALQ